MVVVVVPAVVEGIVVDAVDGVVDVPVAGALVEPVVVVEAGPAPVMLP